MTSKLDRLKILKKTKARKCHGCSNCEKQILSGGVYWQERVADSHLNSLHSRRFCEECYGAHGDGLLFSRKKRRRRPEETDSAQRKLF